MTQPDQLATHLVYIVFGDSRANMTFIIPVWNLEAEQDIQILII